MADEGVPEAQEATEVETAAEQQQIRLNFENVKPEYANFTTLTVRQGDVFLSFGKAFAPAEELKVDKQMVMSVRNVQRLHQAMGRLLESQQAAEEE